MPLLVDLADRTFAVEPAGSGTPEPVAGGLILPPGRVAILHGLGDALFYRHGQNSWSPCGWRRLSETPLRIANPERRLTADDTIWDDPNRHHSSAVAALQGADGRVLLLGSLGLGTPRLAADQDALVAGARTTAPRGSSRTAPSRRSSLTTRNSWLSGWAAATGVPGTSGVPGTLLRGNHRRDPEQGRRRSERTAVRRRPDRRRLGGDGWGLAAQRQVPGRHAGPGRTDHRCRDAAGALAGAVHRAAHLVDGPRTSRISVA